MPTIERGKCNVCQRKDLRLRRDGMLYEHTATPAGKRVCKGSGNKPARARKVKPEPEPVDLEHVQRVLLASGHLEDHRGMGVMLLATNLGFDAGSVASALDLLEQQGSVVHLGNGIWKVRPRRRAVVDLRSRLGLPQTQLADLLGVSVRTVSRLESTGKEPTGAEGVIYEALVELTSTARSALDDELELRFKLRADLSKLERRTLWIAILQAAINKGAKS